MLTDRQYEKLIEQIRDRVGNNQHEVVDYVKQLDAKKYKGLWDYYRKTQNDQSQHEITEVPNHVHENLAQIAAKNKIEMDDLVVEWSENINSPEMAAMMEGAEQDEKETEAWRWISIRLNNEMTRGGRKDGWTFTLFHVDQKVGTWNKWVQKPGQNDPKNQIQTPMGIAGAYGLFRREREDEEDEVLVAPLSAFDDAPAKRIVQFQRLVTYRGILSKSKRGFSLPDDIPEYEVIGPEQESDFIALFRKFILPEAKQPSQIESMKISKKGLRNVFLDCRILDAISNVSDNGTEMGKIKICDSDIDPMSEPKAYWVTFFGDQAGVAFDYQKKSRIIICTDIKTSTDYGVNLNGRWILPVRALKSVGDPVMIQLTPPED